ncbi:MAG: AbrB/MazE/SpoVT family DNA-binding domain-containing protein [Thermoplasmatales archaeon]|nr:MAG: AbrB/MazE/SpoVT family DNA-binding domain-containing protein [Thermoplasmatales archaeon]
MIEVAITKLSSKGQIVIPSHLRKDFKIGEELLILKKDNQVILQRMKNIDKKFKEELKFALRTEKALTKYEKGEFKQKSAKEFLEDLEKW